MEREVKVTIRGYKVEGSEQVSSEELLEVAFELQSDIGMCLADLGFSCTHGHVDLEFGNAKATTE